MLEPPSPFHQLEQFCDADRQAFSLYVVQALSGSVLAADVPMSKPTYLAAKRRLTEYLAANPLQQHPGDAILNTLADLQQVDIRLLSVFFYLARLYREAWWSGKPFRQLVVSHRALAAACKPLDYKAVPELLTKLSVPGMGYTLEPIGEGKSIVQFIDEEAASFHEALRDSCLREVQEQARLDAEDSQAAQQMGLRRGLPSLAEVRRKTAQVPRHANETAEAHLRRCIAAWVTANRKDFEHYFSIEAGRRPESNEEIHQDVLTLIRLWNEFAAKPNRKVAKFKIPTEYLNKGVISTGVSAIRAIEDWIVATGTEWYAEWERVLQIAEENLFLRGLSNGTARSHIEGDEHDWGRKTHLSYGKPDISLPWFFKVDTSDNPLRRGFRIDNVLNDHYLLFTDAGRQHHFDDLLVAERRLRLEYVVDTFNALSIGLKSFEKFKLSPEYFVNPADAQGAAFLDDVLEWTAQHPDWKTRWDDALTVMRSSRKRRINLFDTFERLVKKPRTLRPRTGTGQSEEVRELLSRVRAATTDTAKMPVGSAHAKDSNALIHTLIVSDINRV